MVPARMKNHQGFVSPAPRLLRNHHPRKTKMNREGAVPGCSKDSVPGPCKLMAKERNTLTSQSAQNRLARPPRPPQQAGGSRRDGAPSWAQDHGKPAAPGLGWRWGSGLNTWVSPEGQVLSGPVFTRVHLKGFRTHTLLKTHKLSHAESRFTPLFLDQHFSGSKRIYKVAVDTAPCCGHHPSELQDVTQILEALKNALSFKKGLYIIHGVWCMFQ